LAYDAYTTARLRDALGGLQGVTEKRMMGSVWFMLNGNMLAGAHRKHSGERLFMFRVGPSNETEALARPGARPMQSGNRAPLRGFVLVDADITGANQLREWISIALSYVGPMLSK
jgi:hypothetical protein